METSPIRHVSDTAIWVATFRARESDRKDALFKDPLARVLVGEEGEKIANRMKQSRATGWSVIVRTCIIDDYIRECLSQDIDTVVNLGAGLDTRPYRMKLPPSLRWIEVDHPEIIRLKNERLRKEVSNCILERVVLDLTDSRARRDFFSSVEIRSKRVLILTEGVLPYLSNDHVFSLAQDLHQQIHFNFWIVDYWSRAFHKILNQKKNSSQLDNAPFLFNPPDWEDFFISAGWNLLEMRYTGKEGKRLNRPPPAPLLTKVLRPFVSHERREELNKLSGYALLKASR